jgi:UDP-2-acetamido-3-amino-2,3-dideoxy-glucuronate N-acetyltransferase
MMECFVHPQGICESRRVGRGTRIWAFAHVLEGAQIGEDCNICDHTFIENDVIIGNRVTIKCGVQIWDGIRIEDDAYIGPNATFTNDPFPRSKAYPDEFQRTVVEKNASIGANATILPGLTIGRNAMVGAGAVVSRSVPPNAIAVGNPARIKGYANSENSQRLEQRTQVLPDDTTRVVQTSVKNVTMHKLSIVEDMRGNLAVGEFERDIPFACKRYFIVSDVPSAEVRGEHAHRTCHVFLVCVRGSCAVVADDGTNREEFLLDHSGIGIHVPPMVWGTHYKYTQDANLLVFASKYYDPDDYIRDYKQFLSECSR